MPKIYANSVRVHVTIPADLYEEFMKDVEDRGSKFSTSVNWLIQNYVDKKKSILKDS